MTDPAHQAMPALPTEEERAVARTQLAGIRRQLSGVDKRALQLCQAAEPHGAAVPCPAHQAEATRQLRLGQRG